MNMKRSTVALGLAVLALVLVAVPWLTTTGELGAGAPHRQNVRGLAVDAGTSWAALDIDQTSTGNIAVFRDGGTAALTIADGGGLTMTDDLTIGNGTPDVTQNGEDLYVEGTSEFDGAMRVDGAATFNSTLTVDTASAATTLIVQDYVTPTGAVAVIEDSGGTDVTSLRTAPPSAGSFDFIDVTDTLPILDGTDTVKGIDINLTGANHTGSSNVVAGIDLQLTTADAQAAEYGIDLTDTDWDFGIYSALDQENYLLPTWSSATVITTTDGALWTIGATEVWYIDRIICNVTTNFDCTGDDCTIEIGLTGGDIDGFLDLDDAELQTTDAEISGLAAGWQGFGSTDTRGAFFAAGGGAVMTNDTIDIKIEDNSDQSNPTAGAATCYIQYTILSE